MVYILKKCEKAMFLWEFKSIELQVKSRAFYFLREIVFRMILTNLYVQDKIET